MLLHEHSMHDVIEKAELATVFQKQERKQTMTEKLMKERSFSSLHNYLFLLYLKAVLERAPIGQFTDMKEQNE